MQKHTYNLEQLVRVSMVPPGKDPRYTLKYQKKIDKWYYKQEEGFVFVDILHRHLHGTAPFSRKDFEEKFNCIIDTEPCPKGTYKAYRKPYVECTFAGDNESFVEYFDSIGQAVKYYDGINYNLKDTRTVYEY